MVSSCYLFCFSLFLFLFFLLQRLKIRLHVFPKLNIPVRIKQEISINIINLILIPFKQELLTQ